MQDNHRLKRGRKLYLFNATMLLLYRLFSIIKTKYLACCKAGIISVSLLNKLAVLALFFIAQSIPTIQAADDTKETELPEVTVMVNPFESHTLMDMAQSISVLKGDRLRNKREASLGDTLSGELGVASSSFGPGAGRPIIRTLGGPRIQILENGIGTHDVSSLSPDRAVTVESLNASKIEILRGRAMLLYGGGAIGSVVNVLSNRIPRRLFKSLGGNFETRGNTATAERSRDFNAYGSIGEHISLSASGFRRKTSDYSIPGRANKSDSNSRKGTVRNSGINSGGGSIGGSIVGERGFLGGSVSRLENKYDIPSPETPRVNLVQNRYDMAGELDNPVIGFDKLKVNFGYSDYQHKEIENTSETGTIFRNRGLESRTEFLHAPIASWKGVIGAQFKDRSFSALGEEAIIPKTNSRNTNLFLVEERNWDRFRLEFGGRYEHASQDPKNGINHSRKFNLYTVSVGGLWKFIDGYNVGISVTRGQRAPATEELYTNGPHYATETFQTGNHRH